LRGQSKRATRDAIVETVDGWLEKNRLSLPEGFSEHSLAIVIPGKRALDVTLYTTVIPLPGPGKLHLRRQQIESNLGEVIEKALKEKLPKLVRTHADKRILLFERQHMNLHPKNMFDEVEKQKPMFPDLALVDEIWIPETMFYEGESYLRFERFENGTLVGSLDFLGANLLDKFENGVFVLGSTVASARASEVLGQDPHLD
jgi:hypothetical protein